MADIYDEPVAALRDLHDSFRATAGQKDPLSPMRIAATQEMFRRLVEGDSSQGVRDEIAAIKETSSQASRAIPNNMGWTFLTETCESFLGEIDGKNPQNSW